MRDATGPSLTERRDPPSREVGVALAACREMTSEADTERLLLRALRAALDITGADLAAVVASADGTLVVLGEATPDADPVRAPRPLDGHPRIPAAIVRRVCESGEAVSVGDVRSLNGSLEHGGRGGAEEARALECLPLETRGRRVGAFVVQSRTPGSLQGPCVVLLALLGAPVAAALEHARLLAELGGEREARRRAEEEKQQVEELNHRIIETLPGGIVHVSAQGAVLTANAAAMRLLGLGYDELTGRRTQDFEPETIREDGTPFLDRDYPVTQAIVTGEPQPPATIGVRRPDGELTWAVFTAVPVKERSTGAVTGAVVTFLDITERKRAELDRQRFEAKLQQAQKLESLGVLAGGIAHDFNNLLVGVLGYAGLARLDLPRESRAHGHIDRIETAARRAAELTKQMLAYSGRGKFQVLPVNLDTLVQEMGSLLTVSIPKNVTLVEELHGALPAVEVDPSQVRQVVMNLITNAADSIGSNHGEVTLRTGLARVDPSDNGELHLPLLPGLEDERRGDPGLSVFLEVEDSGCGMDEQTRERIFDPFFTTKMTGRGLGLAAVLGIVRGHGGTLRVLSEIGRGTTFRVCFPACGTTPAALTEIRSFDGGRERSGAGYVLVVDDDDSVRGFAAETIAMLGFRLLVARDGLQGVETFRAHAEGVALVLLDLSMPRMGGEEALGQIRRMRPDVPVLLMSGYAEEDATRFTGALSLSGFIEKPFGPTELAARIREILG